MSNEVSRLRLLLWEIAVCRHDPTLVHEIVQQALGYDPDLENHEVVHDPSLAEDMSWARLLLAEEIEAKDADIERLSQVILGLVDALAGDLEMRQSALEDLRLGEK